MQRKECTETERAAHKKGSQPLECEQCLSYLINCRVSLESQESYQGMEMSLIELKALYKRIGDIRIILDECLQNKVE